MLTKVLLKKDGPLGNIVHHFIRIEYQHRGTQHAHCLLWAEDAPKADASDEEVINGSKDPNKFTLQRLAYITHRVTARMPDEVKEPRLHNIIKQHQKHWDRHSQTCLRPYKVAGKVHFTSFAIE